MKLLLTFSVLAFSFSTFAGTFSKLKIDKLINPEERAEWYVVKYNPRTINWGIEINSMARKHSQSCGKPFVEVSREAALDKLRSYYREYDLVEALKPLVKSKKITKAISASDGDEGESEYCSRASFKFYSIDGEVLEIDYDYNT